MGTAFERVVIVMLENSNRSDVLANPYMNDLRKRGVFMSNAYGVTHSSQPNYICATGGDSLGFKNDDPGYAHWIYTPSLPALPVASIVDLLEGQGLSWKAYAEDLPVDYVAQAASGYPKIPPTSSEDPYFARKHVPFLSYPNIITNPSRAAKIVGATEFEKDLANGTLPVYSWYTPNLINDGHTLKPNQPKQDDHQRQTNIDNIADFLAGFLGPDPVSKFPTGTLVVITFDEAYPYWTPYEIYTLLIGDMLQAGTTCTEPCNHYSLLRSVEVNFHLGCLQRNDAVARPYWFLRE